MEAPSARIHLAGRLTIETGERRIGPSAFPGRQGRTAFAFLVCERARPVSRAELAELLWPDALPASWESALNAIMSKLRTCLLQSGIDAADNPLSGRDGCYELRLPPDSWIDVEVAQDSIHQAEAALGRNAPAEAYGPSAVAHHIARREFLPGGSGRWVEHRREKLRGVLLRALECRARVYLWNHEYPLAVEAARDAVALSPFRETAYQLLMQAHAAAGNTAEALRVYEACRALISEELGVDPSRETKAVHAAVLRAL